MNDPAKKIAKALGFNPDILDKGLCIICRRPASEFRDEVSRKEYKISGTCQQCQDIIFTDPEN